MFGKMLKGFPLKARLTPIILSLMIDGPTSAKGQQTIMKTPELLTDEADLFLKSWMDAYNLSDANDLESWTKMFQIRKVLEGCRKVGFTAAFSQSYPQPGEVLTALDKMMEVDIFWEDVPKVIEENQILLSEYALSFLSDITRSPKASDEFEDLDFLVDFLGDCRSRGTIQVFEQERLQLDDMQDLFKLYSQRPKAIHEVADLLKRYPHLQEPQFAASFAIWAKSLESPFIRANYLARCAFIEQVWKAGFDAAYDKQQAQPDITMLHETVTVFLLSSTLEDAANVLRKNACLLLPQAISVSEEILRGLESKDPRSAGILKQRHDYLVLSQSIGVEQAYLEKRLLAEPKRLEKVLDIFFEGDWSDWRELLRQNEDLLSNEFERIAEQAIARSQNDGETKVAEYLGARLQLVREYKALASGTPTQSAQNAMINEIVNDFILASPTKARAMVIQYPFLLSDSFDRLLGKLVEHNNGEDELRVLMYGIKRRLLQRCREVGVDQAFAEYLLSSNQFVPEDAPEKYKSALNHLSSINFTPDERIAMSDLKTPLPGRDFDDFPETLYTFIALNQEKEIAQAILDDPMLLSSRVEKFLTEYAKNATDPTQKRNLDKKIALLQECRQRGVRETLSEVLDKSA